MSAIFACVVGACSDGGGQGVQLVDRGACDVLIDCAGSLAPEAEDEYEQTYGPNGTCWDAGPDAWASCRDFCSMTLDALNLTGMLTGQTCGTCSTDSDCADFGATAVCDGGFCELGSDDTMADAETSGDGDTSDSSLSHAADIQPIWDSNCVSCHGPGGSAFAVLDLSGDAQMAVVNVPSSQTATYDLVEPGRADLSYLIAKLRGMQVSFDGLGGAMPAGGPPLSEATILTIEAWIDEGAAP